MIVVDASTLANALADGGPDGDAARRRMSADPQLNAPELVDLEVISTFRRRRAAGDLSESDASGAIADLVRMPIRRFPHAPFAIRIWALRENLSPYDAAYVALAEALGCPLVTADIRLARAPGLGCPVEIVGR